MTVIAPTTSTTPTTVHQPPPPVKFDPTNYKGYEMMWPKEQYTLTQAWDKTKAMGSTHGIPAHAWVKKHTKNHWVYGVTDKETFDKRDKHVQNHRAKLAATTLPLRIEGCYASPPAAITEGLSKRMRLRLEAIWPWYVGEVPLSTVEIATLANIKRPQLVRNLLAALGLHSRVTSGGQSTRPPSPKAFRTTAKPSKPAQQNIPQVTHSEAKRRPSPGLLKTIAKAKAGEIVETVAPKRHSYRFDKLRIHVGRPTIVEMHHGDVVLTTKLELGVFSLQQALDHLNKNGITVPYDAEELQLLGRGCTYIYPAVAVGVDITKSKYVFGEDGSLGLLPLNENEFYKAGTPLGAHLCKTTNAAYRVPTRTEEGIRWVVWHEGVKVAWFQ